MKSTDFCYWLQGFFEISGMSPGNSSGLTLQQVDVIQKHLNLVFKHEIDPSYGDEKQQAALNAIHNKYNSDRDQLVRC